MKMLVLVLVLLKGWGLLHGHDHALRVARLCEAHLALLKRQDGRSWEHDGRRRLRLIAGHRADDALVRLPVGVMLLIHMHRGSGGPRRRELFGFYGQSVRYGCILLSLRSGGKFQFSCRRLNLLELPRIMLIL